MSWLREISCLALVLVGLFICFAVYAFCRTAPGHLPRRSSGDLVRLFVFRLRASTCLRCPWRARLLRQVRSKPSTLRAPRLRARSDCLSLAAAAGSGCP